MYLFIFFLLLIAHCLVRPAYFSPSSLPMLPPCQSLMFDCSVYSINHTELDVWCLATLWPIHQRLIIHTQTWLVLRLLYYYICSCVHLLIYLSVKPMEVSNGNWSGANKLFECHVPRPNKAENYSVEPSTEWRRKKKERTVFNWNGNCLWWKASNKAERQKQFYATHAQRVCLVSTFHLPCAHAMRKEIAIRPTKFHLKIKSVLLQARNCDLVCLRLPLSACVRVCDFTCTCIYFHEPPKCITGFLFFFLAWAAASMHVVLLQI